ncbi:serine protease, S1-C subfamily, contains C-terminal PDZ domain [Rubritalea squalenifaciens DSM 18772]|uniref:Serine protease, S1-C subfamily, contains C-terminal PDZ domain n=1 Tax=Rubritalea squalenifaciens DSM 18772 TaxID=1123071 RepID=A0A1M6BCE2_9BACT|nr:S1C family serine protease [Rubritalea squalenifaciens]SHI46411.1 serine protease, S1-C subfamily, contains C-terminal PDZ domain [Rubritalea squalenifaciens DSM 18772]
MYRSVLFLLLALALMGSMLSRTNAADQAKLYQKVAAASFEVHANGRLAGSGWFAPEKGWAFTAFHVVGSRNKALELHNGKKSWKAVVHAIYPLYDVALLKVEGETPEGLAFEEQFSPVGEELYLYGAPLYRHGVWLPGRVARPDLTYEWMAELKGAIGCFHVAGHAPKGVSGGPWVNSQGELVGLQSGTMSLGNAQQGISFVTPASAMIALLETKKDFPVLSLGCAFEELAEQPPSFLNKLSKEQTGVVLKVVMQDGPLGKAGLQDGDILVSLDGVELKTRNDAYAAVQKLDSKKPAKLVVLRAGDQAKILELAPVKLF